MKVKLAALIMLSILGFLLLVPSVVLADTGFGTDYAPGANGTLAVQVFYGNGTAANNATVTANMYYTTNSTKILDGVSLIYLSGSQGIYRYSFVVPSEEGVYLVEYISSSPTGYSSSEVNVSEAAAGGANITASDIQDIADAVLTGNITALSNTNLLGGALNDLSILFGGENMITVIVVGIGLVLFLAAFRWKDLLLSYAAALTWFGIGFWWVLGDLAFFDLEDLWVQILVYIPFILAVTVLLRLMNTEIQMESRGKKWTEWGSAPQEEGSSRRSEYRKVLRKRIGRK